MRIHHQIPNKSSHTPTTTTTNKTFDLKSMFRVCFRKYCEQKSAETIRWRSFAKVFKIAKRKNKFKEIVRHLDFRIKREHASCVHVRTLHTIIVGRVSMWPLSMICAFPCAAFCCCSFHCDVFDATKYVSFVLSFGASFCSLLCEFVIRCIVEDFGCLHFIFNHPWPVYGATINLVKFGLVWCWPTFHCVRKDSFQSKLRRARKESTKSP